MKERREALMRIVVGLISGLILVIWKTLIGLIVMLHWFIVVITGRRNKDLAEFSESFNTQLYVFVRYMTFVSNDRPFPFESLEKNMSKFRN